MKRKIVKCLLEANDIMVNFLYGLLIGIIIGMAIIPIIREFLVKIY